MGLRQALRRVTAFVGTATLAAGMALAVPVPASAAPGDPGDGATVQILGINDLHGRIINEENSPIAGVAVMAGAVEELSAEHPGNTVFAGAGDLIGASIFASSIQQDEPTIDALNAMGLDVSSVGNHEFDQGYEDITGRLDQIADWQYLGANVTLKSTGEPALQPTWMTTTDNGVNVGFVGAVTTTTPEAVSPSGIAKIKFTDIAAAANAGADQLIANGADLVILLVHQGMESNDCSQVTNTSIPLGAFYTQLSAEIDAVITGHTHVKYDCLITVPAWVDAGRAVTKRPVVQSGSYAKNIDQLVFTVNSEGETTSVESNVLPLSEKVGDNQWEPLYTPAAEVQAIVDDAVAYAEKVGSTVIGAISGPLNRGKTADDQENRGAESPLGNTVAEAYQWATADGGAQIGITNPGGLRTDVLGTNADGYPAEVTNGMIGTLLPFGDDLWNKDLTGAQLKEILEGQWQPESAESPFLKLGLSEGFTYTYDPTAPKGEHILRMWLNGDPIDMDATYSVTAPSFLAEGGDNFDTFGKGANAHNTGMLAKKAMINYIKAHSSPGNPLMIDYAQRAVGVDFPDSAPDAYAPGDTVTFTLSSLSFTPSARQIVDDSIIVSLGGQVLGTFPVTTSADNVKDDSNGTATVTVTVPEGTDPGQVWLTIKGNNTDTVTQVGITVPEVLAFTGAPIGQYAGVAVLFLLLGGGLFVAAGRRRRSVSRA